MELLVHFVPKFLGIAAEFGFLINLNAASKTLHFRASPFNYNFGF